MFNLKLHRRLPTCEVLVKRRLIRDKKSLLHDKIVNKPTKIIVLTVTITTVDGWSEYNTQSIRLNQTSTYSCKTMSCIFLNSRVKCFSWLI